MPLFDFQNIVIVSFIAVHNSLTIETEYLDLYHTTVKFSDLFGQKVDESFL